MDFGSLLRRYFQERWLYRLSLSEYSASMVLKGGALLAVLEDNFTRPTRDLDFLAHQENSRDHVRNMVSEICAISDEDGVIFDHESVVVQRIAEQKAPGFRATFLGRLGNVREKLMIDMGFSDVVVPSDVQLGFPTLLDMKAPLLRAYTRESVIAEKFESMVFLSDRNSRMKDFYDIYQLTISAGFDPDSLKTAICATFAQRGTRLPTSPLCLSPEFGSSPVMQERWEQFLSREKPQDTPASFGEVVGVIQTLLGPLCL